MSIQQQKWFLWRTNRVIHNKSWDELEESDYARGCPDAIDKDYSNSRDEGPELRDD